MKISRLEIPGVLLLELNVHGDARGFFVERYQEARFAELGLPTRFVQDNHSRSAPGVLRGLHYQYDPPQGKLIGVVRGHVLDVAVDLRPDSPAFGRHVAIELNDLGGRMLWLPPGLAHGFCVLGDEPADVVYKATTPYGPAGEGGVRWDDPELAIAWPIARPTISARDQKLPSFAQYRASPPPWNTR